MANYEYVVFEAQLKNVSVSLNNHISFARYSSFNNLNHFIKFESYDIMMSIHTWSRVQFWVHLLNRNLFRSWNIGNCAKSVGIGCFSGLCFPAFELNTKFYLVNLCIQFEYWEMWTRKTLNMETFYAIKNFP